MTAPGTLMAGRYRLVERIAVGGMGSVWEAWDELLHRRVAVKQLLPQPGVSAEDAEIARRRLIREARITARLHHPHVVTLYDVVQHDDCPCLIMQYVPSRSLNALLQDRGALPEATVVRIGAEVAAGLAAAHEVGIVHRDVKPGNVLITEDGAAKLTDFGISHAVGDANLTATGMVTGTPSYLAPEVARGGSAGFPADVFSFGATLYAALEGTPPFGTDQNPMAILHRVATGRIIPPRRSGPLTPVLLSMLAVEPGDRPTMAEIAGTLAARRAAGSAATDVLQGPTVVLPPRTVREWPAGTAPLPPGPWQGLVRAEPPAADPEPHPGPDPDPDDSAESPLLPLSAPASRFRAPHRPAAARDRRWLRPALAALVAILVAGAVILVLTRTRGGESADGADPGSLTTTQTSASAPVSEPAAGVVTPPAPVTTEDEAEVVAETTAAEVSEPAAPVEPSEPAASTPAPSPAPAPAPAPAESAPETSTSTPTSTSTTSSSPEDAPPPTADELAGFVTDYYSRLPNDTDQGWERLTEGFQTGIARNRANYGNFWGGIDRVEIADVDATPPGTVEATVTYYFADGQVSVERTQYRLVRAGGRLKIDSSTVLSSRSP